MKDIQYLEIIKRALITTWKNKFLWIFGFLVFLGSIISNVRLDVRSLAEEKKLPSAAAIFIRENENILWVLGVVLFVILTCLFILRLIASAALIKSAANIPVYRQSKFLNIISQSREYILSLFLLELIIGLLLGLVLLALVIPIVHLFALNAQILAIILLTAGIIIAFPLIILAYFLRRYAYFYIILGNMRVKMALEAAHLLVTKNVKESLLMGIILLGLNISGLALVAFGILLIAVFISPFAFIAYWLFAKTGIILVLALSCIAILLLLITIFSWYESFVQTAWLFFFQEISLNKKDDKKEAEKVEVEVKLPSPEPV